MGSAPAIGIDLGTTFSGAAVYRNGKVEVIPNKDGHYLTPSFIYYHPDRLDVSIGETADDYGKQKIDNFLFDVKRLIGRKYDDVYIKKLKRTEEYRFNIVKGDEDKAEIELVHDGEKVCKTPEQASSEILKYLRESASKFLGAEVTEAVISVPAHFSNAQRKATRAAAELAGLKVLKLITEPVAAAIHFAQERLQTRSSLLVFDFGGGTLDVSIIEVDKKIFQVKSVEGDTFLGGRDFDQILLEHFTAAMIQKFGSDIFNPRLLRRVKDGCIRLKTKLSSEEKYVFPIYCIGGIEDRNFNLSLSRAEFEHLTENLFTRTLHLVEKCLKEAGMSKKDIGDVVLVGGTTRIPKVQEMLESYFGTNKIRTDLNPDEAVALGAAVQAALLKNKFQELETYRITEITPLSLGLGFDRDFMEVAIKKNTSLPCKSAPITARTIGNNQEAAQFDIFEGERKICKFNNFLGSFKLDNLPRGKNGDVKFEVIFSLNEDGILEVTGTETSTGKNNKLVVTIGEFRLCDYKIRHCIEDAVKNQMEDKIFETFVLCLWRVRKVCQDILYDLQKISSDIDRKFVKDKCDVMMETLTQLEYTQLSKMQADFKALRMSIKGILDNSNINVDFSVDTESHKLILNACLTTMGLNMLSLDTRTPKSVSNTRTSKSVSKTRTPKSMSKALRKL